MYQCKRFINQKPKTAPMVVQDMTHMANFVYDFYIQRAKQVKEYYKVSITAEILSSNILILFLYRIPLYI